MGAGRDDATFEFRIETRTKSVASPRDPAEPGDQFIRARTDHHHADARQGRAAGRGEDDHAGEARHAAIAPAGGVVYHDAGRHAKALQRDCAEIRTARGATRGSSPPASASVTAPKWPSSN